VTFILLISSCKDTDESGISKFETIMNIDIPISALISDIEKPDANFLKKAVDFSGTKDYQLHDILDLSNNISNIHQIKPLQGTLLSIPELENGYEINELLLHLGYKSILVTDYTMKDPIDLLSLDYTMENGIFQVKLDEEILQLMNDIKAVKSVIRFNITGNGNLNFNGTANLQMPVVVESKFYTPHFSLF
ncbi:MAG TPA: hypothetical protein VKA10_06720, partial [Prolixibacteraceae bacterium]|nr:hypothetical protein [Prolixibacteraceae bacterium]